MADMSARNAISYLAIVGCVLFLSACSSSEQPHMLSVYSDDDFRFWNGAGEANLAGQAFFKLPSGRVVTCAGEVVTLIPATSYNTEMEQDLEQGLGYPADYARKARQHDRKTVCDSAGHFAFEKLPALNWIILTRVTWQEESDIPLMSPDAAGGYIFQERKLENGGNKVILTNEDFVKDAD